MHTILKAGIIECGSIAQAHARADQAISDAEIVGVADIVPGKAAEFINKLHADFDTS